MSRMIEGGSYWKVSHGDVSLWVVRSRGCGRAVNVVGDNIVGCMYVCMNED